MSGYMNGFRDALFRRVAARHLGIDDETVERHEQRLRESAVPSPVEESGAPSCVECGATNTVLERGEDGQMRCLRRKNRRVPVASPEQRAQFAAELHAAARSGPTGEREPATTDEVQIRQCIEYPSLLDFAPPTIGFHAIARMVDAAAAHTEDGDILADLDAIHASELERVATADAHPSFAEASVGVEQKIRWVVNSALEAELETKDKAREAYYLAQTKGRTAALVAYVESLTSRLSALEEERCLEQKGATR